jgi:hypothetical protein
MALLNDTLGSYADAIASIESGGRYDLVGPTNPRYGRALGRYQVMEANLPEWLRDAGLPSMSAEQFLASPQAQDAVFRHRFGQYVDRYGPERAAAAWFAGEKGMSNPNASDVFGTTVSGYMQRFNRALGGGDAAAAPGPAAAPAAGSDVAPASADATPSTGLAGVFGSLFGGNASGASGVSADQLARSQLALDTDMATPEAASLTAPQTHQLDLTRLRALLQGRGRLGTMRG